jgi:hypothetical protein
VRYGVSLSDAPLAFAGDVGLETRIQGLYGIVCVHVHKDLRAAHRNTVDVLFEADVGSGAELPGLQRADVDACEVARVLGKERRCCLGL